MTYSPVRHIGSILWKHIPIHLTFFLTRRCNARCPFCFYTSSEPYSAKDELSLSEIEKISSSINKLLWLAFSGGEIFLRDDLVEITDIFYKKNKPVIILLPTNGLLPGVIKEKTEAILKSCKKSVVVVKLSLEGTESVHDSFRGAGSFQKTMQTYHELGALLERYQNFELGVNTVFFSENQNSMDELIELVKGLGNIKTHTVSLIRGEVSDERLRDVDTEKYLETIKKIETNLKKRNSSIYRFRGAKIKAAQDIVQRNLIYETIVQNKQQIPCYAGRLNIVITETGDVYPCEEFTPQMKMGNLRENGYNIKKVLKTDLSQRVIHSIQENRCYCTHECFIMTNLLFNPRTYPVLLKEYIQI
jgi:radical SAM protein with 4Fe4S-binding SPASM domain